MCMVWKNIVALCVFMCVFFKAASILIFYVYTPSTLSFEQPWCYFFSTLMSYFNNNLCLHCISVLCLFLMLLSIVCKAVFIIMKSLYFSNRQVSLFLFLLSYHQRCTKSYSKTTVINKGYAQYKLPFSFLCSSHYKYIPAANEILCYVSGLPKFIMLYK